MKERVCQREMMMGYQVHTQDYVGPKELVKHPMCS